MDEKRFDAWTRRQLGLGAGGLAAALFGLQGLDEAEGKKRSHKHKSASKHRAMKQDNKGKHRGKHKGKHKGKNNGSNDGSDNDANNGRNNGEVPACKKAGSGGCTTSRPDCCAGLTCQAVPGFGGVRCCADVGATCSRDQQCCSGVCSGGACAFVS